jgi:hypothetical protein
MMFCRLAAKHGPKVLHMNNNNLLVQDLSDAMEEQKAVLTNPRQGSILTAYDVLPVIAEVKIMSHIVAYKFGIDTKDKPAIQVLDEIAAKAEEQGYTTEVAGMKRSLDWTRDLFTHPEIQSVMKMDVTGIEKPQSIGDLRETLKQIASRAQQEVVRVDEFLKRVKKIEKDRRDPPRSDAPRAA